MPPLKRAREESQEENNVNSDQEAASLDVKLEAQKDDNGNVYWELSKTRRIGVSQFNKKTYVNIREYFKDKNTGNMMPGKKGIMLTIDQWKAVCSLKEEINSAIANVKE